MSEKRPKFTVQVDTPIEVVSGADADKIGKHYANLNQALKGEAYDKLGQEVESRFKKKPLGKGKTQVTIVEDHY